MVPAENLQAKTSPLPPNPRRQRNIELGKKWVGKHAEPKIGDAQHGQSYSTIRFNCCPAKPDDGDGGFALKVFDNRILVTCFHEKCRHRDWEEILGPCPVRPEPWYQSFSDLKASVKEPRRPIIEGLMRLGDVGNIIAPSKLGKSYFRDQLSISIAAGVDWFGYSTRAGRVLLVDNELHRDTIVRRLEEVIDAMGLSRSVLGNVEIAALRGNLKPLDEICDLIAFEKPETFSLVVFDALYRMLPRGTDENSNSDVTALYNMMDQAATQHRCGLFVIHHTSKGVQVKKNVTDVGSGAGAQSRAADCHIVLRPHAATGTVVLEGVVRDAPPIEPIVLRRDFPLWVVDEAASPADLRGKAPTVTVQQVVDWLPVGEQGKIDTIDAVRHQFLIGRDTARDLLAEAVLQGLLQEGKGKNNRILLTK